MRKNLLIIIAFTLPAFIAQAQNVKKIEKEINKAVESREVLITGKDSLIRCHIPVHSKEIKVNQNESYYWYENDKIHVNMGSYSGSLLNGEYLVTNPDGALITKGAFINGQKDGKWTSWLANGKIKNTCRWSKGKINGKMKEYDKDGNLIQLTPFKNNIVHGTVTKYTEKSTIQQHFKSGILKWEKTIFAAPKKRGLFNIL